MNSSRINIYIRAAIVTAFAVFAAVVVLSSRGGEGMSELAAAQKRPTVRKPAPFRYLDFPHSAKAHQLECASCHKPFPSTNWNKVRSEKDAFPDITDYPHHESCVGCHKQLFFKGTPPRVCSICHTNPSPNDSSRHPFPNPRELFDQSPKGRVAQSDFIVGFPHDKHIEIVSSTGTNGVQFVNAAFSAVDKRRAAEESCSVCHQTMVPQGKSDDEYFTKPPPKLGDAFWLKKGTFKIKPIGHTVCFTCHNTDSGILPAPTDCGTCHKLKGPQPTADFDLKLAASMGVDNNNKVMFDTWRRRISSRTFRHEWFSHADASCSTCHNVLKINTADPLTEKVSVSACATCHATPTSDDGGALNYEMDQRNKNPKFQCAKCHVTFGKLAIPASHKQALTAATGK